MKKFVTENWFKISILGVMVIIACIIFYFVNEQQRLDSIKREVENKNALVAHQAELEQQAQQNKLLEEANNLKKQEILRKQITDSSRSACLDLAYTYYQRGVTIVDSFYQNCLAQTVIMDGTTYRVFSEEECDSTRIGRYQDNDKLYSDRKNECYVKYPNN